MQYNIQQRIQCLDECEGRIEWLNQSINRVRKDRIINQSINQVRSMYTLGSDSIRAGGYIEYEGWGIEELAWACIDGRCTCFWSMKSISQ